MVLLYKTRISGVEMGSTRDEEEEEEEGGLNRRSSKRLRLNLEDGRKSCLRRGKRVRYNLEEEEDEEEGYELDEEEEEDGDITWFGPGSSSRDTQRTPDNKRASSAELDVIPVTCGSKKGTLNVEQLARGEMCIQCEGYCFSPPAFENFGGKGYCKKWKHSIYYDDQPLELLFKQGLLTTPGFNKKRNTEQDKKPSQMNNCRKVDIVGGHMVPVQHRYPLRVLRKEKGHDEVPGEDEDSEGESRTENNSEIKEEGKKKWFILKEYEDIHSGSKRQSTGLQIPLMRLSAAYTKISILSSNSREDLESAENWCMPLEDSIDDDETQHSEEPREDSIHPSIHLQPLIRSRVAGATAPPESSRHPCPEQHQRLPPGGYRDGARPGSRCNPSILSLVCPGVSSQWDREDSTATEIEDMSTTEMPMLTRSGRLNSCHSAKEVNAEEINRCRDRAMWDNRIQEETELAKGSPASETCRRALPITLQMTKTSPADVEAHVSGMGRPFPISSVSNRHDDHVVVSHGVVTTGTEHGEVLFKRQEQDGPMQTQLCEEQVGEETESDSSSHGDGGRRHTSGPEENTPLATGKTDEKTAQQQSIQSEPATSALPSQDRRLLPQPSSDPNAQNAKTKTYYYGFRRKRPSGLVWKRRRCGRDDGKAQETKRERRDVLMLTTLRKICDSQHRMCEALERLDSKQDVVIELLKKTLTDRDVVHT